MLGTRKPAQRICALAGELGAGAIVMGADPLARAADRRHDVDAGAPARAAPRERAGAPGDRCQPHADDIRTTCPRDCYDACGALVRVADGRVVHVRGDPEHPVSRGKLCRKCTLAYNGVFLDAGRAAHRAARPAPGQGRGRSKRSAGTRRWALIAERARRDRCGRSGPDHLLALHRQLRAALVLLRDAADAPSRRDRGCAGHDLQRRGPHRARLRLRRLARRASTRERADAARCILVWGANPSASAPHQHEHWLRRGSRGGRGRRPGAHPDGRRRPTSTCSRSPAATRRSPSG